MLVPMLRLATIIALPIVMYMSRFDADIMIEYKPIEIRIENGKDISVSINACVKTIFITKIFVYPNASSVAYSGR